MRSVQSGRTSIDAMQLEDGRIMVSLKRVCEALGVSYPRQYRKLMECTWAGVAFMATPDERGRPQRLAMIDLESLPMWLVTIHPSKVAFGVRAKLLSSPPWGAVKMRRLNPRTKVESEDHVRKANLAGPKLAFATPPDRLS